EPTNININMAQQRVVGDKRYEMQNHLNSVMVTVTDRKLPEYNATENLAYYKPDVVGYSDYSPFGVTWRDGGETGKYGFNGMEKDDEIKGKGNSYDFGARMYDSRVGRWFSRDPLEKKYPHVTPYIFSYNSPILFNDPDGKEAIITVVSNETGGGTITISADIIMVGKSVTPEKIVKAQELYNTMLKNGSYVDVEGNTWEIVFDITVQPTDYKPSTVKEFDDYAAKLPTGQNAVLVDGHNTWPQAKFSGNKDLEKDSETGITH
ncbi:RHS repeat-associated core domain-containing protein, partial [Wandonia haliotis]